MKTVEGENYLTVGETAKLVKRSAQTIKSWYRWSEQEQKSLDELGLPAYRRDLDGKQTYHFNEKDIPKLIAFREDISYGQMADFNVGRWGKRGKDIESRKHDSHDEIGVTSV